MSSKKNYIGLGMFLAALSFFGFFRCIDYNKEINSFDYMSLGTVLLFVFHSSIEMLKVNRQNQKYSQRHMIIMSLFSVFLFLSLLGVILGSFKDKHIIVDSPPEQTHLISCLSNFSKYALFSLFGLAFALFLYFLFNSSFRTQHLTHVLLIFAYISVFSASFLSLILISYKWFLHLFLITIASDSFAYFIGNLYGKRFLFPSVSPKKTWEGFLGAIVATTLLALLFYSSSLNNYRAVIFLVVFAIINSIIAQMGDLIASKFKRDYKIKDFSNLVPGHGGLLDRFDSILFLSFFIVLILLSPWSDYVIQNMHDIFKLKKVK
ncbi:phosphatidate cytidylyltransferase [Vaccinium witches'-broom phytoplasma]|uniref:phosphatidate cytidylyltransferase n=1 Tax=Vaccinium witches'-broom phytoplasma TaxID=85642 RepID=UPI000380A44C|nr:phosphatidate cytidylyltransferase [Vaccinium witches'-broom phytoplasma]